MTVPRHSSHIPLFPLSIFLLPGERTVLHIFEPRYRQLIDDVEMEMSLFGIPFFGDSQKQNEAVWGSLVRVVEVIKKYHTGESDIVIEAVDLFELKNFNTKGDNKLYPIGEIELIEKYKSWPASSEVQQYFDRLMKEMGHVYQGVQTSLNTFQVLRTLNMEHDERVRFLKMDGRAKQEEKLVNLLKFSALILQQEKKREFDFFMN